MAQRAPNVGKGQEKQQSNMGKRHIAAAVIVAAIIGCNNIPTLKADGIETETTTVDTSVCLINNMPPQCHIYMKIKYAKGNNAAKINKAIAESALFPQDYANAAVGNDMEQRIRNFAQSYIADYRKELGPLFRADNGQAALYEKNLRINTSMKSERGGIITYTTMLSEIAGDGSATTLTKATNISLKTARRITTDDILVHGSDSFVKKLLCEKLCKKFRAKDMKALRSKGILCNEDIYIPDNFIIGRRHITFIFNSDEIAPHDLGEIRITIDDEELENLLKLKS